MDILVLAAHPDDEVLGMGGTIKKLSKNNKIHLCVVSEGASAQYAEERMMEIRRKNCIQAGKLLGISTFDFLAYPDMRLDAVPTLKINQDLERIISKYKPRKVYTTPSNDLNKDHQIVFESTLVAARPHSSTVRDLLSYEIPAITSTPFRPVIYEDITREMAVKIRAFKCYKSELEKFPHPRSIEAIESLAMKRGFESSLKRAESFELIRSIID